MQRFLQRFLVVNLLHVAHNVFSIQLDDADLNRLLDYLHEQAGHIQHSEYNKDSFNDYKDRKTDLLSILNGEQNMDSKYDEYSKALNKIADVVNINDLPKYIYQTTNSQINKKSSTNHKRDRSSLVEHPKVYLVLDSQAKINDADFTDISNIVSQLLSLKQKPKKQRRYKGFAVMDNFSSRRRIRDSNEKFSKDSIERDYKPKRARNDYGGGAGRTAIPYIRHRGDIYEKE